MESVAEDQTRFATRSDKLLDYINSALLTTIFVSFAVWWLFKNFNTRNSPKRNLRLLTLLFYFVAVFSEFYSSWLVIFLSSKVEVDKTLVERMGHLEGSYRQAFGARQIDLIAVYNVLLTVSQVLKISTLFLMVASWLPVSLKSMCPDGAFLTSKKDVGAKALKNLSNASIATFAKCYVFFRIPSSIMFVKYQTYLDSDTVLFIRSIFLGMEVMLCALFLLILKTKYQGILGPEASTGFTTYSGTNIFIAVLLFDSFFNYIINVLSIPLILSEVTGYVMEKIGFLSHLMVNVILLTILCPQGSSAGPGSILSTDLRQDNTQKDAECGVQRSGSLQDSDELVDVMTYKTSIHSKA